MLQFGAPALWREVLEHAAMSGHVRAVVINESI